MKKKHYNIIYILVILLSFVLASCEKEEVIQEPECCTESRLKPDVSVVEQVCCDWDASNFDPEYNGHNVNQLYFTGSNLCNNDLCVYENY